MNRDLLIAGIIWIILTIAGEVVAATVDFYPVVRSDKGEDIEHPFRVLIYLAVPVFMFVVTVLCYSIIRFRTKGDPEEDGPPIRGQGAVPSAWLAITSGLTLLMIIYPGIIGIDELFFKDEEPDLVVEVRSVQWAWIFNYADEDVSTINDLVLPVDRNVKFEITSTDVLHSFWIPSFLMKIDAVPGKTTEFIVRPTKIGSFKDDELLRVQCAELCGLSHSKMAAPLTILEPDEFDAWLAEKAVEPTPSGETPAPGAAITMGDNYFEYEGTRDPDITLAAGEEVTFALSNTGTAIHNMHVDGTNNAYEEAACTVGGNNNGCSDPNIVNPGSDASITVKLDQPGTYNFRCDFHPSEMIGRLVVE